MAVIKYSDEIVILVLTDEGVEAGELEEILTSVVCGEATHFLVDMSELQRLSDEAAMKIFQLKEALAVWGSKLIVVHISHELKHVFAKLGIVSQLDFAADRKTALGWLGKIVAD